MFFASTLLLGNTVSLRNYFYSSFFSLWFFLRQCLPTLYQDATLSNLCRILYLLYEASYVFHCKNMSELRRKLNTLLKLLKILLTQFLVSKRVNQRQQLSHCYHVCFSEGSFTLYLLFVARFLNHYHQFSCTDVLKHLLEKVYQLWSGSQCFLNQVLATQPIS